MAAERIHTAKVLLIQYGPTMSLAQVKAAFMPSLTDKAVRNRVSRGDLPPMRDGMFDTQQIGEWWDGCAPKATAIAAAPVEWTPSGPYEATVKKAIDLAVSAKQPSVYLLLRGGRVVYVGMSNTPFVRLSSHVTSDKEFDSVALIHCPEGGQLVLESVLIAALRPEYNIAGVPIET